MTLVGHQGILDLELCVSHTLEPVVGVLRARQLTLSVKGAELGFVLDEVVLVILEHSLVVEVAAALALGLSIFVGILHLFVPDLHVAGPDRLDFVVERPAEHVLLIFDVKAVVSL